MIKFILSLLTLASSVILASHADKQNNSSKQENILNPLYILAKTATNNCHMQDLEGEPAISQEQANKSKKRPLDAKASKKTGPATKKKKLETSKSLVCNYPECSYIASNAFKLKRHYRKHTGEKPYACNNPGCSYAANEKNALTLHIANHHEGDKSFTCHLCNYICAQKRDLDNHKLTHTGEKPFKCDWDDCSYATAQKSNLKAHIMRKHTGEKPFKCTIAGCNFATAEKASLIKHLNSRKHKKPNSNSAVISLLINAGKR